MTRESILYDDPGQVGEGREERLHEVRQERGRGHRPGRALHSAHQLQAQLHRSGVFHTLTMFTIFIIFNLK